VSERVRFLLGVPQDTSSLSSSMRLAIAADTLALGDEGAGAEIEIRSSVAAHMGFTPIETESLSKGGFERVEGPFRLSPVGGHARLPGVRGEPAPHLIHYLRRKHDGA